MHESQGARDPLAAGIAASFTGTNSVVPSRRDRTLPAIISRIIQTAA